MKTAVEWLINEMHKKEQGLIETSYNHLFDQAKEMEKEQIIDAQENGQSIFSDVIFLNKSIQYYYKKFNK